MFTAVGDAEVLCALRDQRRDRRLFERSRHDSNALPEDHVTAEGCVREVSRPAELCAVERRQRRHSRVT